MLQAKEIQIAELKDRIASIEQGRNSAFEKQIEYFESKRQELQAKIEKLQAEVIEKEKQVAQLQNKIERIQEENARRLSDFDFQVETLVNEKEQLTHQLDGIKECYETKMHETTE